MENKVVVHLKDGTIHKGLTQDFAPNRETFFLLPAEGGGVPLRVEVNSMKALFYVKSWLGNRDFVARQEFDRAKAEGQKAIVTFSDGETMWGTVPQAPGDDATGFFFFPVDEEDNNERVFVVKSSLKEMRFVP